MTYSNKSYIAKCKFISQILYIATIILIDNNSINKWNKSDFLWSSKPAKIKYENIIAPKEKGGLKFPDIESN